MEPIDIKLEDIIFTKILQPYHNETVKKVSAKIMVSSEDESPDRFTCDLVAEIIYYSTYIRIAMKKHKL